MKWTFLYKRRQLNVNRCRVLGGVLFILIVVNLSIAIHEEAHFTEVIRTFAFNFVSSGLMLGLLGGSLWLILKR